MTFLSDMIEKIRDLSVKATEPRIIPIDDPRNKHVVLDGKQVSFPVPPPVRNHQVNDIDSLMGAVVIMAQSPVVYHNEREVVAVLDDGDRRDRVSMKLRFSDTYGTIRNLKSSYDQHEFVDLLRHDLRRELGDILLPKVRKIEVATRGRTDRDISPGRERGTQEFEAKIADAERLPEVVQISMPVYSTIGVDTAVPVKLSLNFNVRTLHFELKALPDELDRAVQIVQGILHDTLETELENKGTVLYGSP